MASNSDSEDLVVLITGCSKGGMGHALALAFAMEHCFVVATARSLASIQDLAHIPNILTLQLDVTSQESRHQAISAVMDRHGRIDILVNNAGMLCVAPVAELPLSLLEDTFKTNVYGIDQLGLDALCAACLWIFCKACCVGKFMLHPTSLRFHP